MPQISSKLCKRNAHAKAKAHGEYHGDGCCVVHIDQPLLPTTKRIGYYQIPCGGLVHLEHAERIHHVLLLDQVRYRIPDGTADASSDMQCSRFAFEQQVHCISPDYKKPTLLVGAFSQLVKHECETVVGDCAVLLTEIAPRNMRDKAHSIRSCFCCPAGVLSDLESR